MTQANMPVGAYQTLVAKTYAPAFFEKLAADWNINPASPEERSQLLELAGILRQTTETETVKQAQAGNSFLTDATDSLKNALSAHGHPMPLTSHDNLVKQAAGQLSMDPEVQQASLEYGSWLASMMANQG
jgi:hypothetical protein